MKLLWLLLGGAKLGKLALTGGSMLLSIVAYAWLFGWGYAVGFVVLILIHEMGHYLAARRRGLDVGAPTFIPFVGAWIELKQQPHDAETEAYVGMAGPLVGTLGALAFYAAARATGSDLLLALAYAGFFLNLFNLIPVSPFDGGRISAVISPRLWLLGAPLLVALFLWRPSPLLVLMAILAAPQVMQALRGFSSPEQQSYYLADAETRTSYAALYLGLAGFLAVMCHELHAQLPRAF
ncbi:site-2 protease family protein [Dokdonella sp.]|uniref:site-2 protease family protein n=1 Tax=Dokdonella sp. TaxID=2291710 RepID=UPI001B1ED2C3|nr:site-2 protease family protein [Dokdonella sp.]MBO9664094.1 site-2 protease family protein [Dokdonella sp.]